MTEILSLLAAAVIAVLVFTRLGLGSVLGYLAAGAIIGPHGLALITDAENLRHIGEFGVVFLLFMIGLELKPQRLWIMRRLVFGLGGAQVLVTGALFAGVLSVFAGFDIETALIIGFGLALSSTAFGVQILSERNELTSHYGRNSFSILLFQDLAVVPLMMLLPLLAVDAGPVAGSLGLAVAKGAAILIGVLVVGRYAMGPLMHAIARIGNSDVFVALTLLLVLGFAWVMGEVGLSLAMGAFIAGVLLADSEYKHQIEADILPFRGLLLGLFFMSVGMTLDPSTVVAQFEVIIFATLLLLVLKCLIIIGISRMAKAPMDVSVRSGLLLSQSGEFGFVIFSLALGLGLLDSAMVDTLIAIIVLSMASTPLLVILGVRLGARLKPAVQGAYHADAAEEARPVIVAGFGRVGETIANMLDAAEVPYVGVDSNADCVAHARRRGYHVVYGSAAHPEVLRSVGASHARLLVVTLDDAHAAEGLVRAARRLYPDMPIHVRARDWDIADHFKTLGVDHAIPETVEASLRLGAAALEAAGVEQERRHELFEEMTAENFSKMRQSRK